MGGKAVAGVPQPPRLTLPNICQSNDSNFGMTVTSCGCHKVTKDSGALIGTLTGWRPLMACPGMGAGHAGRMTTRRCTTR